MGNLGITNPLTTISTGNLGITNPLTTISTGNEVKFNSLKIQYYIQYYIQY